MSQDDEYEYEERASSPLERKSAMEGSQKLPPSVKTQWKPTKDDMDVTVDVSPDAPAQMDVDDDEEDLPPPRLVQQKQLPQAPYPVFEADVKGTRASSSQPQARSKVKPEPASTRVTRNTRSSKVQEPEVTSEDSLPSDSSEAQPVRKAGPGAKKKR